MLILSRKSGESLIINDNIEIKIIEATNDKVKLGFEAPKDVKILRKELCLTVESNKESSSVSPSMLHSALSDLKKAKEESGK